MIVCGVEWEMREIGVEQEAESAKVALRPDRRRQYIAELDASAQDVFSNLESCLTSSVETLRQQVPSLLSRSCRHVRLPGKQGIKETLSLRVGSR